MAVTNYINALPLKLQYDGEQYVYGCCSELEMIFIVQCYIDWCKNLYAYSPNEYDIYTDNVPYPSYPDIDWKYLWICDKEIPIRYGFESKWDISRLAKFIRRDTKGSNTIIDQLYVYPDLSSEVLRNDDAEIYDSKYGILRDMIDISNFPEYRLNRKPKDLPSVIYADGPICYDDIKLMAAEVRNTWTHKPANPNYVPKFEWKKEIKNKKHVSKKKKREKVLSPKKVEPKWERQRNYYIDYPDDDKFYSQLLSGSISGFML